MERIVARKLSRDLEDGEMLRANPGGVGGGRERCEWGGGAQSRKMQLHLYMMPLKDFKEKTKHRMWQSVSRMHTTGSSQGLKC